MLEIFLSINTKEEAQRCLVIKFFLLAPTNQKLNLTKTEKYFQDFLFLFFFAIEIVSLIFNERFGMQHMDKDDAAQKKWKGERKFSHTEGTF